MKNFVSVINISECHVIHFHRNNNSSRCNYTLGDSQLSTVDSIRDMYFYRL